MFDVKQNTVEVFIIVSRPARQREKNNSSTYAMFVSERLTLNLRSCVYWEHLITTLGSLSL